MDYSLIALFRAGLGWFSALTDCGAILPDDYHLALLSLALGVLLCFLGFMFYRVFFSALIYLALVSVWCIALKGNTPWINVVTGFSVTGCVLGFFAFRWTTAGAILTPVFLAAAAAYAISTDLLVTAVAAIVVFLLAYGLPLYCTRLVTSVFGAALMLEASRALLTYSESVNLLSWYALIPAAIIGLLIQHFSSLRRKSDVEPRRGWAKRLEFYLKKRTAKEA